MKKRVIGLDLLRVFAAFGIMMYHFFFIGPLQGFYSMDTFIQYAYFGEFGVDLFFILSGYSIFLSIKNKERKDFILSRIKRIYPAFFLCATFTLLCGFIMPDTSIADLVYRYLFNFTFLQDFLDIAPLSSVYWTLMVEVKFYILIYFFAFTDWWRKDYHTIISLWLMIAIVNTFLVHNILLEKMLLTQYAGHFVMGMLIFSINSHEKSKMHSLEFVLCSILIWNNCASYSSWIQSLYEIGMTEFRMFLFVMVIISGFFTLTNMEGRYYSGGYLSKCITYMSSCSYIFYLIHADLGYFCRTQWYNGILPLLLKRNIVSEGFMTNEKVLLLGIVLIVICVTMLFHKILTVNKKI